MTSEAQALAALQQARMHEQAGRLEQAIDLYQQALHRWPALPDSWYNLALLLRRAGRHDDALASYQQALNRGISQPEEVHLNRGVIFSDDLNRSSDAQRELALALRCNPGYVPALLNLANLHEDLGDRESALATYERLLTINPQHPTALARYAAVRGISGAGDALLGVLRDAIGNASTTLADKANLSFALGQGLDKCHAYDDAFAAYRQANAFSRASAGGGAAPYDRVAQEQLVLRLMETFQGDPISNAPLLAAVTPTPIFICGMFRSGSTLAEQILARHSRVSAGGEISFLPELVRTRLNPYPSSITQRNAGEFASIAQLYLQRLKSLAQGGSWVTDKRPDNFLHIGLIKTLFPHAKIVHTTRNALDNGLSIYFLHLDQSMPYALDLADIGHNYCEYQRLMAHWKSRFSQDIHDFDYDLLVRAPRPSIERLLEFCGLPWEEECLQLNRVSTAVRTASVWQVRQHLYQHSSGRWRHYERHLTPLMDALARCRPP